MASRGSKTRQRIVDAALELFTERGYEQTTMRDIAAHAGVAVGNVYYYFDSKQHLVVALYGEMQQAHDGIDAPILQRTRSFEARLCDSLHQRIEALAPFRRFAGKIFAIAADPESGTSPFGEASRSIRDRSIDNYRHLVSGSDAIVPSELEAHLPRLLWLYQMGLVLYWVHDRTDGAERTHRLIEQTAPLVTQVIGLAAMPIAMPGVAAVASLLDEHFHREEE